MKTLNNISAFDTKQVLNTDLYCVNALEKDIDYLLAFDVDRLLAGFRETAGLDMKGAKRYDGWESTLIGGHTLGHYLSAIAYAYTNPGVSEEDKETIYNMITALVDGLLECQNHSKGKEKFLFGAIIVDKDNVEAQFDNVEKDLTNIITQAWVPWYTLHKLLAGVIDVYKHTKYEKALEVAKNIGDWTYNRELGWDEITAKQVIRIEYGGMNEVLYELYSLTNEDKYAIAAHYFDSVELFERINQGGKDCLNNHHANTTIPKFIGALNRYCTCHGKTINGEIIDASKYFEYAKNFWDIVVDRHTYITGGNSEWEHFGRDFILDKERTNCNCETCNIYNMLKLSRTLFCITGNKKYADYYENAFYNTILSSQNPETGMTTYFQPMSTGYFKVFGERFNKFWCCTGTGMENFTKLNDSIFFNSDKYVIINLYESAKLSWQDYNCLITMNANLQASDKVHIKVETLNTDKANIGVALRVPEWIADNPKLLVNNEQVDYVIEEGYILLDLEVDTKLEISLTLPMKVDVFALPDDSRSIAFKYGPTVLSADLGCNNMTTTTTGMMVTIPAEKDGSFDYIVLPENISPEDFIGNANKFLIRDINSEKLSFELSINGLKFAPHFSRYKERYGIYFIVKTEKEILEAKQEKEKALLEKPEGKIIDTVQPGYGQYENDELHRMYDWGGSVGSTEQGTTRYAKSGGSFTYHMCVVPNENNYLSLTFLKEDNQKTIKINSGDEVFFEDVLDYDGNEESYEIRVQIPDNIIATAQLVSANGEEHMVIPLTFRGSQGAQSARLFGFVYTMIV